MKIFKRIALTLMLGSVLLSACTLGNATATPTEMGVEAVYTAAAQTLQAQLTSAAAAQPSATQTPPPTETATSTVPPLPTSTQAAGGIPPISGGSGCNNAAYVSDVTIPDGTGEAPGAAFTKTWRLQNTGTCAWNTGYKISFVSGTAMSGVETSISQSVAPGATLDVSVNMIAPVTSAAYTGYWRMSTDTGQPFGTTVSVQIVVSGTPVSTTGTPGTAVAATITPTFGASGCNNSAFVTDVTVPDGSTMSPGQTFTKTWRIKNIGTCAWTSDYKFTYIGGDLMGSDTTKIRRTVAINATTDFSLTFVAPTAPGTYTGYWRMATDSGALFGVAFSVKIVVPGATFTPTATATLTQAPTATATPTQEPTATETLTQTPTAAETSGP